MGVDFYTLVFILMSIHCAHSILNFSFPFEPAVLLWLCCALGGTYPLSLFQLLGTVTTALARIVADSEPYYNLTSPALLPAYARHERLRILGLHRGRI